MIEEVQDCSRALGGISSNVSLTSNTPTPIPINVMDYDNNGWLSGGKYVVPAGVSHVRCTYNLNGSTSTGYLIGWVAVNGGQVIGTGAIMNDTGNADVLNGTTAIIPVNEGDELELYAQSQFGRNILADTLTWFAVEAVNVV